MIYVLRRRQRARRLVYHTRSKGASDTWPGKPAPWGSEAPILPDPRPGAASMKCSGYGLRIYSSQVYQIAGQGTVLALRQGRNTNREIFYANPQGTRRTGR